jgi:hypothetical protein
MITTIKEDMTTYNNNNNSFSDALSDAALRSPKGCSRFLSHAVIDIADAVHVAFTIQEHAVSNHVIKPLASRVSILVFKMAIWRLTMIFKRIDPFYLLFWVILYQRLAQLVSVSLIRGTQRYTDLETFYWQ